MAVTLVPARPPLQRKSGSTPTVAVAVGLTIALGLTCTPSQPQDAIRLVAQQISDAATTALHLSSEPAATVNATVSAVASPSAPEAAATPAPASAPAANAPAAPARQAAPTAAAVPAAKPASPSVSPSDPPAALTEAGADETGPVDDAAAADRSVRKPRSWAPASASASATTPGDSVRSPRSITGPAPAPAASVLFGAAARNREQVEEHETDLGRQLSGVRVYQQWDDRLFNDDMRWMRDGGRTIFLSVRSQRLSGEKIPYAAVAAARPGSALWADMLNQAAQVRDFGATVWIAYQHEPEAATTFGTGAEFVAAWQNLVTAYRAAGAANAKFVWTMTGFAFAKSAARAQAYWPGPGYVDAIGADVYNFYNCNNSRGLWNSFDKQMADLLAFGARYPTKPIVLMEWSSVEDPSVPGRKAAWIADATAKLKTPAYHQVAAALQWSGRNYGPNPCTLDATSSPSALAALRDMGADPAFRSTGLVTAS